MMIIRLLLSLSMMMIRTLLFLMMVMIRRLGMMTSIEARLWEKKHLDQVELAPNNNQLQLEEVEEVGGQVLAQPSQVLIYPINF